MSIHLCYVQLFSIEGRNEQDYLHQMERDACISYVADAVCYLFQILFSKQAEHSIPLQFKLCPSGAIPGSIDALST